VNGLGGSAGLQRGDFVTFQKVATDALAPRRYFLVVKSADGTEEYVNTSRAPSELHSAPTSGDLQLGIAGKGYLHQIDGRWMALVDVPIENASGKTLYTMTIGVPNGIFQRILIEQRLPQNWKPVILDADWRIVARGESLEKYVGRKGAGEEFRNSPTDRIHQLRILEGVPSVSAHSQSSRYGWTTAIAVADADIFNQVISSVLIAALGGFAIACVAIVTAALFATYLAGSIRALADMVEGFPETALAQRANFGLRELALVASALHQAAADVLRSRASVTAELEDMRHLNELSNLLIGGEGEDRFFEASLTEVAKAAVAISRADKGNLRLFDPASGKLRIVAQCGFDQGFLKFFENTTGATGVGDAVIKSKKQLIVEDVLTSEVLAGRPVQKALLDAQVRALVSTPLMSSKGNILGLLSIHFRKPRVPSERVLRLINLLANQAADYLQRKEYERTQATILHEVEHRSNNLLSVVQAIAHRSLTGDYSLAEGRKAFEARLHALARANRALLQANLGGVSLSKIVRTELEAFSDRARIADNDVILPPEHAQRLTLVLHELATNAAKYGALSKATGKVDVSWKTEGGGSGSVLKFVWREGGGPPVVSPARHGFGTSLITATFPNVRLDYASTGMICEIDVALTSAPDDGSPPASEGKLTLESKPAA
jgi:two-component sensor histidine kinase